MSSDPTAPQDQPPTRTTDRRMPTEDLPYPLGLRRVDDPPDDNRLYGLLGDQAVFEHIGLRPRIKATTSDEVRAFGGRLNDEIFSGLKNVFGEITDIEVGHTLSPASMTTEAEFATFASRRWVPPIDDPAHFFAFRSRDAEWAGFRWHHESFRFRRASLLGFVVESAIPARSSGYFQVSAVCVLRAEPGIHAWRRNVEEATFYFGERWTAEVAFELLSVMTNVANFLGTTLTASQFMDV
ncbi:hypothetical protein PQR05_10055 [Paraburkholderia sediminicola]|uniref:hypothetical protein n=1 Tax=Paraburkholderia TaxID=1822464 RepID=UPI0038BB1152